MKKILSRINQNLRTHMRVMRLHTHCPPFLIDRISAAVTRLFLGSSNSTRFQVIRQIQTIVLVTLAAGAYAPLHVSADPAHPYVADANTVYLFHLDEPSGSSVAINAGGTLAAGTNAVVFDGNPYAGDGINQPIVTTVLGTAALPGFGYAADLSAANDIGIGIDRSGDGGYMLDDGSPFSVDRFPAHHFIGAGNAFTLEALVNLPAITGANREIIATDSFTYPRGFQFRINIAGNLEFDFIGTTPSFVLAPIPTSGTHAFVPNEWFHVAITHTESPTPNTVLYWTRLNGANVVAHAIATNHLVTVDASVGGPIVIGNEGRYISGEGLLGLIDEVRISNIARDASDTIFSKLVVPNSPPVVTIEQPASGVLASVGQTIQLVGSFTDDGPAGSHTAQWTMSSATVPVTTIPGTVTDYTVSDLVSFAGPGIYSIKLVVTDAEGASGEATTVLNDLPAYVVVYDPSGSFVTGGGWIWSPKGALHPDLEEFASVEGKATFGFVSKYQKGASVPTGQTEFQFKAGDLDFHSSSYQWLVVAGARAQFKGTGTVNGEGDFGFLLTAVDGQVTGVGGQDRFRIKIWDVETGTIIYDNQVGALDDAALSDATILQGGSIVIHQ